MPDEIEKLLALGRMDLEAGYPEYAREYFEKVLVLDAANREAIDALAEIDALLERRRASFESVKPEAESAQPEVTPAKPTKSNRSIIGWIRKKREERARIVAERKSLAAEKREVLLEKRNRNNENDSAETPPVWQQQAREAP